MKKIISLSIVAFSLSGCGTVNNFLVEKTKTVEYYRIFDIKTDAPRSNVADAASNGLGRNVSRAKEATPIPSSNKLPAKAGRFALVKPFGELGAGMNALMSQGGQLGYKIATCDEASWTASAVRTITGQSELKLTACLFPYVKGYHLDLYATFVKKEGGIMELSRKAATAMVGTPEEWTEKTFLDIVREIQKDTGATVTYLEGAPELHGTPWLDSAGETQSGELSEL